MYPHSAFSFSVVLYTGSCTAVHSHPVVLVPTGRYQFPSVVFPRSVFASSLGDIMNSVGNVVDIARRDALGGDE